MFWFIFSIIASDWLVYKYTRRPTANVRADKVRDCKTADSNTHVRFMAARRCRCAHNQFVASVKVGLTHGPTVLCAKRQDRVVRQSALGIHTQTHTYTEYTRKPTTGRMQNAQHHIASGEQPPTYTRTYSTQQRQRQRWQTVRRRRRRDTRATKATQTWPHSNERNDYHM